jgi:hypothetical protein
MTGPRGDREWTQVVLRFAKPQREGRDFRCAIRSQGSEEFERISAAAGVDSVQALELAMHMAAAELITTTPYREGRLTYLGTFDLRLPVMEPVRHLIREGRPPRHMRPRARR